MDSDSRSHIRTIPVALGRRNSYVIIYASLLLFLVFSLLHFRYTLHFMQFNAMIVSALATYFVVEYSPTRNTDMDYLYLVDGMMLLQALLVMTASV
jgi:1,4-dihydroxy-2-naphthoate octaprenyltransferase